MNKYFVFAFVAASLFFSFLSHSNVSANKTEAALYIPAATPKPKIMARIERIEFDKKEVLIACPPNSRHPEYYKDSRYCDYHGLNQMVSVKTIVSNPMNIPLTYEYTISGGRLIGGGENVMWDLSRVRPETYTLTVSIKGKRGVGNQKQTKSITLRECDDCLICVCFDLGITGSKNVRASETVVFKVTGLSGNVFDPTYNWTISQGEIVKGQGTRQIKVKTTPEMSGVIKVTVEIDGSLLCADCPRTASETIEIIK